jgi:putative CocE/NonD family hydrolase
MSDRDDSGHAWRVTPTEYLRRRPPTHSLPAAPRSCYVGMRDGCRLAVDVYLPQSDSRLPGNDASRFPAIVILTPYYRRFKVTAPGADPSPNAGKYRDFFVPRGYALVVVDVRGCGASFGTRDSFRSPREREDYRELADWIVAQPWSNGAIGSTGISYLGAAACFLASTGHPAVKAIAPLFSVSDTYSDHLFPGGIMCTTVTATYDDLVRSLDLDQRDRLARYPYFDDPRFAGPQPVDEDRDGFALRTAIDEHRDSFRLRDLAPELAYREEPTPHDPELHSGACSPYWYLSAVAGKVAIYSISGWYDGCAFANGSISRFLTNGGTHDRLLLGPWDHGARTNGSPWRGEMQEAQFPVLAEVLRFFDEHVAGIETGIADEAPIHYHTVRAESWQAASRWPPLDASTRWFLQPHAKLSPVVPRDASAARHRVRFTTGTGTSTRYERLGALAVTDYYHDWNGREDRMLAFTSEPFGAGAELTGHAVVKLCMSTSEHDASVFVYLSEVDADGRSWYITEGALRMLHRATAEAPPAYRTTWPFRTFSRAAARRMQRGVPESLHFALLPVSWKLAPGSRIRLSITGTDADHFAQVPHGRPPELEVVLGGGDASFVELPLRQ